MDGHSARPAQTKKELKVEVSLLSASQISTDSVPGASVVLLKFCPVACIEILPFSKLGGGQCRLRKLCAGEAQTSREGENKAI